MMTYQPPLSSPSNAEATAEQPSSDLEEVRAVGQQVTTSQLLWWHCQGPLPFPLAPRFSQYGGQDLGTISSRCETVQHGSESERAHVPLVGEQVQHASDVVSTLPPIPQAPPPPDLDSIVDRALTLNPRFNVLSAAVRRLDNEVRELRSSEGRLEKKADTMAFYLERIEGQIKKLVSATRYVAAWMGGNHHTAMLSPRGSVEHKAPTFAVVRDESDTNESYSNHRFRHLDAPWGPCCALLPAAIISPAVHASFCDYVVCDNNQFFDDVPGLRASTITWQRYWPYMFRAKSRLRWREEATQFSPPVPRCVLEKVKDDEELMTLIYACFCAYCAKRKTEYCSGGIIHEQLPITALSRYI